MPAQHFRDVHQRPAVVIGGLPDGAFVLSGERAALGRQAFVPFVVPLVGLTIDDEIPLPEEGVEIARRLAAESLVHQQQRR